MVAERQVREWHSPLGPCLQGVLVLMEGRGVLLWGKIRIHYGDRLTVHIYKNKKKDFLEYGGEKK